jgi:hypothetical protein
VLVIRLPALLGDADAGVLLRDKEQSAEPARLGRVSELL